MSNKPAHAPTSLATRLSRMFILWLVGTFVLTNVLLWWGAHYFVEGYLEREVKKLLVDYDELGTPLFFSANVRDALDHIRLNASRNQDILFVRYYSAPYKALLGRYVKDDAENNEFPVTQPGEFAAVDRASPLILTNRTLGLVESMRAVAPVRMHSLASDSLFDLDVSRAGAETSKTIGYVEVGMDVDSLRHYMAGSVAALSAIMAGVMVFAYFMGRRSINRALAPFLKLQNPLQRLADGDFNVDVQIEGADREIAAIGNALTNTVSALRQRDAEKEEAVRAKLHAELASQAKSQFVAHMSHEIRTPLSGLTGFVNLLGKTELNEVQRAYLRNCEISAKSLMSVINDILDFSKIEAGKLSVERMPMDLREVVDDCVAVHAANAEAKALNLVVTFSRGLPTRFVGDPLRITQILSNLIGNAIKFTEEGEVVVTVGLADETADRATVQFEVVDTGIGIAAQDMAKLFQPFTQVNDASNRQIGGTGLGLIISKKLIELMGGKIRVHSHPGAGSCFIVELPLQKLGPDEEHTVQRVPMRVMVVSSNYLLANAISESLAAWGMRDEIVDDPQRALALLAEARARGEGFHAVIVDSAQPGMSAAGFSADVRHTEEGAHTCLILLAGAEERVRREAGACPGYDECLGRPAKGSELLAALSAAGVRRPDAFAPDRSGGMRGLRILVVDDHEINRDLITIMLESHGAQVEQAANGAAAVDACASRRYDLVLMDINMPGLDGLMATARIRALEAGMPRTPIIALTANAMIDDRQRYLAAGMDDCLVKPPGEKSLQAIVAAYCGRAKVLPQ